MGKNKMAHKSEHMMNTQNNSRLQRWIGLIHLKPMTDNDLLDGASGAFVQVLALATGIDDFVLKVEQYLDSCGFEIIEIEDVELYKDRIQNWTVSDDIKKLSESLSENNPILLDIFQAYN